MSFIYRVFLFFILISALFAQDSLNMRFVGEWSSPEPLDSPYGNLLLKDNYL